MGRFNIEVGVGSVNVNLVILWFNWVCFISLNFLKFLGFK